VNVVHRGTLHVDLAESSVAHRLPRAERFEPVVHGVQLVDGSRCAAAYGFRASIPVTSGHHQAVDREATGLGAAATAADGLVEALESADPAAWVLGVQWHPEAEATDPELRLPLFVALLDAVRGATAAQAA
jgi:putative glutamine amidotransferase